MFPKLSLILEYPPPKPKTGWRVWRDIESQGWIVEMYFDGKRRDKHRAHKVSNYEARKAIYHMYEDLSEDEKEKFNLAELFNEAM